MTDTRWVRIDFDPNVDLWPARPEGARVRTTVAADGQIEFVEFEVPRLPTESGWYRFPNEFGVVFLRDDGTWLDARGSRAGKWTLPDGLIRLVDEGSP